MATKHTPGPWKSGRAGHLEDRCVFADGASAFAIATVHDGGGRHEVKANAALISAAPELLSALCRALIQYEAFVKQCCKGEDNRGHERTLNDIRAAIKKAGG